MMMTCYCCCCCSLIALWYRNRSASGWRSAVHWCSLLIRTMTSRSRAWTGRTGILQSTVPSTSTKESTLRTRTFTTPPLNSGRQLLLVQSPAQATHPPWGPHFLNDINATAWGAGIRIPQPLIVGDRQSLVRQLALLENARVLVCVSLQIFSGCVLPCNSLGPSWLGSRGSNPCPISTSVVVTLTAVIAVIQWRRCRSIRGVSRSPNIRGGCQNYISNLPIMSGWCNADISVQRWGAHYLT